MRRNIYIKETYIYTKETYIYVKETYIYNEERERETRESDYRE